MVECNRASNDMVVSASITNSGIAIDLECASNKCVTSLCIYCEVSRNSKVIGNIQSASNVYVSTEGSVIGDRQVIANIQVKTNTNATTNDQGASRGRGGVSGVKQFDATSIQTRASARECLARVSCVVIQSIAAC